MADTGPVQPTSQVAKSSSPWGVFDSNGNPVFDVDTFLGIDDDEKSKVSDFPVEEGAFASYNKVQHPYILKVRMAVGGDVARMTSFINALSDAKTSTELYIVATPATTFQSASLDSFSYKQEAHKGADMIVAEISFKEIRIVSTAYTNATLPPSKIKNKSASDKKDDGKQQPAKPSDWKITEGKSGAEAVAMAQERLKQLRGGS
jgi:Dit-like phage tail protein